LQGRARRTRGRTTHLSGCPRWSGRPATAPGCFPVMMAWSLQQDDSKAARRSPAVANKQSGRMSTPHHPEASQPTSVSCTAPCCDGGALPAALPAENCEAADEGRLATLGAGAPLLQETARWPPGGPDGAGAGAGGTTATGAAVAAADCATRSVSYEGGGRCFGSCFRSRGTIIVSSRTPLDEPAGSEGMWAACERGGQ
jgi:hypothetical protein